MFRTNLDFCRYYEIKEKRTKPTLKPTAENIDGSDSEDNPIEITMNSYNKLFCIRCFKYDCLLHSKCMEGYAMAHFLISVFVLVDNPVDPPQQTRILSNNSKPCSSDCYKSSEDKSFEASSTSHSTSLSSTSSTNHPFDTIKWSNGDKSLVRVLSKTFSSDYCVISKCLPSTTITCRDVYELCINESNESAGSDSPTSSNDSSQKTGRNVIMKRSKNLYQHPYSPCNHSGPCNESNCSCNESVNFCEKYCYCNDKCSNRFLGCKCKKSCQGGFCPCYSAGRECDPDLCTSCGADKIDKSLITCQNISIQRNWSKHLLKVPSKVAGWGVVLKDGAKKNDFIAEYRGEMISFDEAERRGKIYDKIKGSYLFNLNSDYAIDATAMGNKTRFINHSKKGNIKPKVLMVNGDHRIGFFAIKDIKPHEEIFFDYGYPENQLKTFDNIHRCTVKRNSRMISKKKKKSKK